MKNHFKILFTLIIAFSISSFSGLKSKKFDVAVWQNGKEIEIIDNEVFLDKAEFQLKITLKNHDGVFMFASFKNDYYNLKDYEEIKDYKWLNFKTMAENSFNEGKKLIIAEESISYLFYDKDVNWHRFDKDIVVKGKKIIGSKSIDKIYLLEAKEVIPLTDIEDEIYFFFVATDKYHKDITPKEFGRLKLKVNWR